MAPMTNTERQKKWREKKENEVGLKELRKNDRERQQFKRKWLNFSFYYHYLIELFLDDKKLAKLELNLNTLDVSHRNVTP